MKAKTTLSPNSSSSSALLLRRPRLSPYLLALLGFIVSARTLLSSSPTRLTMTLPRLVPFRIPVESADVEDEKWRIATGKVAARGGEGGRCGVLSGRWVADKLSQPLYQEEECPYIQPQLTCQAMEGQKRRTSSGDGSHMAVCFPGRTRDVNEQNRAKILLA